MTSLIDALGPPDDDQARRIVAAWSRGLVSAAARSAADEQEASDAA